MREKIFHIKNDNVKLTIDVVIVVVVVWPSMPVNRSYGGYSSTFGGTYSNYRYSSTHLQVHRYINSLRFYLIVTLKFVQKKNGVTLVLFRNLILLIYILHIYWRKKIVQVRVKKRDIRAIKWFTFYFFCGLTWKRKTSTLIEWLRMILRERIGRSQQNKVALISEINNKQAPEKLNSTLWC